MFNLLAASGIKSEPKRGLSLIAFFILNVLTSPYPVNPSYFFRIEPCKSDYKVLTQAWAAWPKCALPHSPRTLAQQIRHKMSNFKLIT